VSWIGCRKNTTGIARIYLDGVFVTEVDTYRPTVGLQDIVFTAAGLAAGNHTLTIEATGQKNAASMNAWIVVDAFGRGRQRKLVHGPFGGDFVGLSRSDASGGRR